MGTAFLRKNLPWVIMSFLTVITHSQIKYPGSPDFNPATDTIFVPVVTIEVPEQLLKNKAKPVESRFKSQDFAVPVDVDITTDKFGVWYQNTLINKNVWLIRFKSANALSMNFMFDYFQLTPGCKLFLYDKNQEQILGAFTHKNNKPWNTLSTLPVIGDEVYVELQVPLYSSYFGDFSIGKVGVEQISGVQTKSTNDEWYDQAAACHTNVNCVTVDNIQQQKRAVCRIIYAGSSRCTGTVINNLEGDKTPYILTAAHCFTSEYLANNAVFAFNFESPDCTTQDAPLQSISGSSIVSYSNNLDFLLLRLSEDIPTDFNVLYSGWDARGIDPSNTYTIHHPQGAIKKISIDEDAPAVGTFNESYFDPNTHWLVFDYETGSSEQGSSGCGLISDENYLIGTLTGGGTTCSATIRDYYQMFSHAFNDYSEPDEQLKAWLDPANKNLLTCEPLEGSLRGMAEVLTNLTPIDSVKTKKQEIGWGYVSGHNYQLNQLFAEHFRLNGSKYLYGANINLAAIYSSDTNQSVVFTIWEEGAEPGNIIYEKSISIADMEGNLEEDIFKFDFDSSIFVHNGFYFGYRINYYSDTFAVKTTSLEASANHAFTAINGNWQMLQLNDNDYPASLAMEVLAFDYPPSNGSLPDLTPLKQVQLYPNPSENQFQVFFKEGVEGVVTITMYDISGRPMYRKKIINPDPNIPIIHNLPGGIYIVAISENNSRISTEKVIVY
ncbi:MAG TPA: hypothetical protein DDX98_09965 [Bacteroidales bacterium]|mgnify:CR=1 FL=1|jgi:lysyl endopeptidase|nr:hypothetical protein [Bacteroidales bacterium]